MADHAEPERTWQHPWLRIELAIRAILADRLTRGASDATDIILTRVLEERGRIERALGAAEAGAYTEKRPRDGIRHRQA